MRNTLLCFLLLTLAVSGVLAQETPSEMLIHISPIEAECMAEAPMTCLVMRELPDGELSFFYDSIAGFEYEAGYDYQLRVAVTTIENPPADASALSYELLEIVAQFPASLENQLWELQAIGETIVENPSDFTLIFNDEGMVAITSDCNGIMELAYTLKPATITVSGMTMMFCEGSLEGIYVNALNTLHLWTIENGELIMLTDEGLLRFAPPAIDGKTWRVQSYSASQVWEDEGVVAYTMNFDGENVALQIACNSGGGTVSREGARIRLDAVVSTLMACEFDPLAGLFPPMDFVYALDTEGRLILNSADGAQFILVEVD